MQQENPDSKFRVVWVLVLVVLLVSVRAFENQLFYDPFTAYFKSAFVSANYPAGYDGWLLFGSWIFRYLLNSVLTVLIVYVVFRDKDMAQFSAVLLSVFLVVLLVLLYLLLHHFDENQKMTLFYVRRFMIQPLFLLLFVPGFYFQKQSEKK